TSSPRTCSTAATRARISPAPNETLGAGIRSKPGGGSRVRRVAFAGLGLLCAAVGAEVGAGEVRGRLMVDGRPAVGVAVSAIPYETPFEEARRQARRLGEPKPLATTASGSDGAFVVSVPADPAGRGFRLKLEGAGVVPIVTTGVYDAAESE